MTEYIGESEFHAWLEKLAAEHKLGGPVMPDHMRYVTWAEYETARRDWRKSVDVHNAALSLTSNADNHPADFMTIEELHDAFEALNEAIVDEDALTAEDVRAWEQEDDIVDEDDDDLPF